jgi:hypothetical protein
MDACAGFRSDGKHNWGVAWMNFSEMGFQQRFG